jgi:adenylate cyclase
LRKTTAVISAIVVALAAIIWGMIYFVAGEDLAGIVPSLYAPLTALNIVVYKFSGRYRAFEFAQLTLNLMLPLLLLLGGFFSSSAVLTWALVTPMGAIVYSSRRMSIFLFVAFFRCGDFRGVD